MDLPEYLNRMIAKEQFADFCAQLKELVGVAGVTEKDYMTDKVAVDKKLAVAVDKNQVELGDKNQVVAVELGE
jgi:hypothetical protein